MSRITKRNRRWLRIFVAITGFIFTICGIKLETQARMQDNAYLTFSPDENAFTTNADERDTKWYEQGYTVATGKTSSLRSLNIGEHYYVAIRTGTVPVGKWTVAYSRGKCIHNLYTDEGYFHGVSYGTSKCFQPYYSGWQGYCADCGEMVVSNFFYMSEQVAVSLDELDMSMAYYYRCPWCTNLEMGAELKQHACQDISANQYSVRYHANFGKGYMPKSVHMYNNATRYEGNVVIPKKTLTLNSYTREGYVFAGWNTKQDGSGLAFCDGQEIWNLCEGEQESIVLYAQWEKCQSALCIDPAGGAYEGKKDIQTITGMYGSTYTLDAGKVSAPAGATVSFDTAGGNTVAPITASKVFSEWSFHQPLQGSVQDNVYTFTGNDGITDYVTAMYREQEIVLPEAVREGYSFGGWYYDREGKNVAGTAGDSFLTSKNITLYACWVELKLTAEDNYGVYEGRGGGGLVLETAGCSK